MTAARRSVLTAGALAVGACAACCAPLVAPFIVPPVAGLIAVGGFGVAFVGQVGIGLGIVAAIVGFLFWRRNRAVSQPVVAAEPSCGCAPNAGCNADDACELPVSR